MEVYTRYNTVDDFLSSNPLPGSLAEVLGTVRTQVRGDTPSNGTLYLVGSGTFLRLLNDNQSNAVLLESSDKGIPVAIKGLARLVEDGYDLQVTEAYRINDGLPTLNLKDLERLAVISALRNNNKVQKDAAKDLGISPRMINYYLKEHMPDVWAALPRGRRPRRL